MFCDEVTVKFIAGRGGNGCIGFRREKYIPKGGPNGGDGGRGGSVYLQANENVNTLAEFNTRKTFRAKSGEHGLGKEMAGSDSPDLILQVPVGTMIFDVYKKTQLLGDLSAHGDIYPVARGGRGGFGNAHFKSSTRQAPRFAELGEPGEENECMLELKLVADVGIIGLPSVGKSTLLGRISNARPKIADYPFTTLIPNLGLVTLKEWGGDLQQNFLACDLPGLIEGAHKGKGLGISFLKHVARNRILVHLIDVNSPDASEDYRVIRNELKSFDRALAKKPEIVAFNKIDTVSSNFARNMLTIFRKKNRRIKNIFTISCVTGEGLKELIFCIWNILSETKQPSEQPLVPKKEFKVFRPHLEVDERSFHVSLVKKRKSGNLFEVKGKRIEQIVVMTDFRNPEAVARVYDVFEKMRINKELRAAGAKFGDEVRIGEHTLIYRWE